MFQRVALFLTCLVETEMFLLMRLNIESYRGDFQFRCTLAFCLLWGGRGVGGRLFVVGIQTVQPETSPLVTF